MSNELAPRLSKSAVQVRSVASLGRRLPRSAVRAVEAAGHAGLASAARVQAASYVTHVAASQVASLSREEALLAESVPAADPIHRERVAAYGSARMRLM